MTNDGYYGDCPKTQKNMVLVWFNNIVEGCWDTLPVIVKDNVQGLSL